MVLEGCLGGVSRQITLHWDERGCETGCCCCLMGRSGVAVAAPRAAAAVRMVHWCSCARTPSSWRSGG